MKRRVKRLLLPLVERRRRRARCFVGYLFYNSRLSAKERSTQSCASTWLTRSLHKRRMEPRKRYPRVRYECGALDEASGSSSQPQRHAQSVHGNNAAWMHLTANVEFARRIVRDRQQRTEQERVRIAAV